MNQVAVVIPAYNESKTIRDVVQRALVQCQHIIVIDDGSIDGTASMIADLPVVLLRNDRNRGKAASLWRGMQHATDRGATAVITLDADGQHQPEDIPRFLEMADKYPKHIIIGSRLADRHAIPPRRYYANRVANFWISWAAGYYLKDSQSGFRLYPASLLKDRKLRVSTTHGFVFESEILVESARHGVYGVTLPISAIYQLGSRPSHFRPVLDIVRITRMVAWRLISRGLYPWGLFNAFVLPQLRRTTLMTGMDGMAMLLFSNIVIGMTGGISLLCLWRKVYIIARRTPITASPSEHYMVLGMRLQDGRIAPEYAARLMRAVNLYGQYPQGKILVLGGKTGAEDISEAQAGRDYLLAAGVPEANILMEDASRHTLENLRQARAILGSDIKNRCVLITSRFHLGRSQALATGLGIRHDLCAADDALQSGLRTFMRLLGEAYYLHWYVVGRALSTWMANRKMLDKIT
jgi:uncharacterized SAM-binding protein YcdF (DUF218 family)